MQYSGGSHDERPFPFVWLGRVSCLEPLGAAFYGCITTLVPERRPWPHAGMARTPHKTAQVKFEIPVDAFEDLRALAKERRMSVTAVIVEAVQAELDRRKSRSAR